MNDILLVVWDSEVVREPSPRINVLFARAFRLENTGTRADFEDQSSKYTLPCIQRERLGTLSSAHRGNIWACARERGVETFTLKGLRTVAV